MSKRSKRWPIWKVAVSGLLCVLGAGALVAFSVFLEDLEARGAADQGPRDVLTLPGFVLMLAMAGSLLAVVCFVWLGLRIKEARTPPWERTRKSRRRR